MAKGPEIEIPPEQYALAAEISKSYRTKNNLSQGELARQLGCRNELISNIEKGYPGRSSRIIAKILELPVISD